MTTLVAQNLIVESLHINGSDGAMREILKKLNELIKCHNSLVYHSFNSPHDQIKLPNIDMSIQLTEIVDRVAGYPLTPREADGVRHMMMLWGWRCRCVGTHAIEKAPGFLVCTACNKPVIEKDGD